MGKRKGCCSEAYMQFMAAFCALGMWSVGIFLFDSQAVAAMDIDVVFVKGGCYQMGDSFGDGQEDEKPVHEVCLSDFYIGKYLVTQGQWKAVMNSNPSLFKKGDEYPVERVSWNEMQEFIRKLNALTGKKYRLPTEAEWEYAARSGGKKEKWSGTSSKWSLNEYAWYYENSGRETHKVGLKTPNALGIYDMSGNVWEWVNDWYSDGFYENSPRDNPQGPPEGVNKVVRGGAYNIVAEDARSAKRLGYPASNSRGLIGLRLALPAH